jgi:hypothetical protein
LLCVHVLRLLAPPYIYFEVMGRLVALALLGSIKQQNNQSKNNRQQLRCDEKIQDVLGGVIMQAWQSAPPGCVLCGHF